MSTQTKPQPQQAEPTLSLPLPPKGHHYVAVPDDIRPSAIQSNAIATLCRIRGGDLVSELEDDLAQLAKLCLVMGGKGKLVLQISVKADGLRRLEFKPELKTTLPKAPAEGSVLFATESGQILSRDPAQPELDLKVVNFDTPEPRKV